MVFFKNLLLYINKHFSLDVLSVYHTFDTKHSRIIRLVKMFSNVLFSNCILLMYLQIEAHFCHLAIVSFNLAFSHVYLLDAIPVCE